MIKITGYTKYDTSVERLFLDKDSKDAMKYYKYLEENDFMVEYTAIECNTYEEYQKSLLEELVKIYD